MDVNLILDELYAERRWLEKVIGLLERVSRETSAAATVSGVPDGWPPGWALRLSRRERARLVRVAARPRRKRAARPVVVPIRQERLAGAA